MIIHDYTKITNCIICGNLDGKLDKFIKSIINKLPSLEGYEKELHPKEVERRERLRANESIPRGMNRPRPSFRSFLHSKDESDVLDTFNNLVIIVNGSNVFGTKSLGYYIKKFEKINNVLASNNVHILFTRGNDDPKYFEDGLINFTNIKTIKDYSVVKLSNLNYLCIGGGVSIDRQWKLEQEKRIGKVMYWENEGINYDEEKIDEIINSIDVGCVITTSSPTFVYPSFNSLKSTAWVKNDNGILQEVNSERKIMDKIYHKFIERDKKPYAWIYSKFTESNQSFSNDIFFKSLRNLEQFVLNKDTLRIMGIETCDVTERNEESVLQSTHNEEDRINDEYAVSDDITTLRNIGVLRGIDIPEEQMANLLHTNIREELTNTAAAANDLLFYHDFNYEWDVAAGTAEANVNNEAN